VEIIKRLKRGGCDEGKKQRDKGKQEVASEITQREEKVKEREEKQVDRTASALIMSP
jgi:hypothetical protein